VPGFLSPPPTSGACVAMVGFYEPLLRKEPLVDVTSTMQYDEVHEGSVRTHSFLKSEFMEMAISHLSLKLI